jgi:glycosyltransferase involved in cell wall biosynthesis
MSFHLLINASNIASAGSEVLVANLLSSFARHETGMRFTVAVPDQPELINGLEWHDVNILRVPRARRMNSFNRLKFELRTLPAIIKSAHPDAVMALGNIAPTNTGIPTVVLLQQPLIADRNMKTAAISLYRWNIAVNRRLFARTARHAAAIVVQTSYMKDLVVENYYVPVERVKVIPNAVSASLQKYIVANPCADRFRPGPGSSQFKLIYPSSIYPYKNHSLILDIAAQLRSKSDHSIQFVVTIDESTGPGKALIAEINRRGLGDIVENAGFLNTEKLAHRYRTSSALFFPSLAESLGYPLMEAAAFGLPVIAADLPYAHAVLGDTAIYFDPLWPESALTAIRRMTDPKVWTECSEQSEARFRAAPTWDEIGQQFLQVVQDVACR